MKILQLIHKIQNRGAETFACQLSNHLIQLGHEVKVVALYDGEASLPFEQNIIILDETSSSNSLNFKGWKKLAEIIKDFNPDVLQANSGDTLKYSVLSKLIFGWKTPLLFRNASEVGRYLKSPLQKNLNKILYKNVDWVISVSQASKLDIVSHFPFLKNRVDVVGVGLEELKPLKKKILHPQDQKHIVHVGGFTFEKNHQGLIEIFKLILNRMPNVHLHLVGDGPLRKEIMEFVKLNSLSHAITFYGFVNDPLSYIAAADVLVLPSKIEGLPGVILEAMSCKTSVVAFNVGGISEILNKNTGYLISANDNNSFAEATFKILEMPEENKIENGYHLVNEQFMNSQLALKFVNSYEKIVPTLE